MTVNSNAAPRIHKVEVENLKPHPIAARIYNYRSKKEIKALAATMDAFGQLEPIVINTNNEIISGRRRWEAAQYLGMRTLNAVIIPKSKDESDLIVFHNQQRRKTYSEIIREAETILGILGKSQGQRNDLLNGGNNPFGKIGRDRFEIASKVIGDISSSTLRRMMDVVEFERSSKENKRIGLVSRMLTKSKEESLSVSAAHSMMRRIQRDQQNRKKASKLRLISPKTTADSFQLFNKSSDNMAEVRSSSVQVVFTSPPYYNLRNYGNSQQGRRELGLEATPQEFVRNLTRHLKDVWRVLSPTGSFFLNVGDTFNRGKNLLIPTRLILSLCDDMGWSFVNEIIWKKTNTSPQNSSRRLQPTYEKVFHLVKNPDKYYYEEFRMWHDNQLTVSRAGGRGTSSTARIQGRLTLTRPYQRFRDFIDEQTVKDVITGNNAAVRQRELQRVSNVDHPALMPDYLPVIPILTTSRKGDVILDPFSGSGTTGRTALLLGRKYIGYELNENNYNLSQIELNQTLNQFSENDLNHLNSTQVNH